VTTAKKLAKTLTDDKVLKGKNTSLDSKHKPRRNWIRARNIIYNAFQGSEAAKYKEAGGCTTNVVHH